MDIGANNRLFLYPLGEKAAVIEYRYTMDETVDDSRLIPAVRDAVESFPYMKLRPFIGSKGEIVMSDNDEALPVFEIDDKIRSFGSQDTGGYLFRVLYGGNNIYIEASHGVGDGRGILSFSQTVIYYYLLNLGKQVETEGLIYTKKDIGDKTLTENLLERIKEVKADTDIDLSAPENLFWQPEEKVYIGTADTRRFVISWNQKELMERIRSLSATPLVFFHVLLARTMYEYYNLSDVTIAADVPVDLRGKLSSRAQSNFTVNVSLPITAMDIHLNDTQLYSILRDRLKEITTIEKLAGRLQSGLYLYDMLDNINLNDEKEIEQLENLLKSAVLSRSYLLSNIGNIKMPAGMMEHVLDVDIYFTNAEATPVYTMLTYKEKGMLIIGQNFREDGFVKAICDRLSDFGLKNELFDGGIIRMDNADCRRFGRTR